PPPSRKPSSPAGSWLTPSSVTLSLTMVLPKPVLPRSARTPAPIRRSTPASAASTDHAAARIQSDSSRVGRVGVLLTAPRTCEERHRTEPHVGSGRRGDMRVATVVLVLNLLAGCSVAGGGGASGSLVVPSAP